MARLSSLTGLQPELPQCSPFSFRALCFSFFFCLPPYTHLTPFAPRVRHPGRGRGCGCGWECVCVCACVFAWRQTLRKKKVSVEPAGRHRRGQTGWDQIMIDTQHTVSPTHTRQGHTLNSFLPLSHSYGGACSYVHGRVSGSSTC